MKYWIVALAAMGLFMTTGCGGPTPQKVCEHVMDIMAEEFGEEGEEPSDEELEEAISECVDRMEEGAEECTNPSEVMRCMMGASDLEGLGECEEVCEEAEGDDEEE